MNFNSRSTPQNLYTVKYLGGSISFTPSNHGPHAVQIAGSCFFYERNLSRSAIKARRLALGHVGHGSHVGSQRFGCTWHSWAQPLKKVGNKREMMPNKIYLESRWCNSHVLVYHGPKATFWELRHLFSLRKYNYVR